jgi:hypothetical protein
MTGEDDTTSGPANILTNTAQALYTGGVPGTPTYLWELIAPFAPFPVSLWNPADASSQALLFTNVLEGQVYFQRVRVTITDAASNQATDTHDAQATHLIV